MAEFNKQLGKLRNKRFAGEEILNAVVKLYRNKPDAVKKLSVVRLNPDFSAKKMKEAACLEFFIPQLGSYYLQNSIPSEIHYELVDFMMEACKKSPFFAHKVYFFFQANLHQYPLKGQDMLNRITEIMHETPY